jgi:serine/threonine-protein kinase ATR
MRWVLHQIYACAWSDTVLGQIIKLANARSTTARRLFEPFWRNLAFLATKDMASRPHTTRSIADMLHITVRELLLLIQSHALPWLVLMKQTDVIQKIAEARGESETWQPIMDPANIGPILALLFVQDVPDTESFVKSRLIDVSSHFRPLSLTDLVLSQSSAVALELLKAAGDAGDERKVQVRGSNS